MDLVEAARKGDEAQFLQLFDQHHLRLFRFAYRLTGSAQDAEDIVQECFLELLWPGCLYDPRRTSLRAYLYGIVRNQWRKRRGVHDLPASHGIDITENRSPEHDILRSEVEAAVARTIAE